MSLERPSLLDGLPIVEDPQQSGSVGLDPCLKIDRIPTHTNDRYIHFNLAKKKWTKRNTTESAY